MSSPAPSVKTEPEVPGTKLGNASNSAYLPPCRICGDKASGFHYGANTCEACKGFFRRSLKRSTELKCPHQGNCVVTSSRRHTCPACRFKKCLEAGMSKTAIKTGRYTHEKKTRDIQEVKQLEIKARMKDDGSMMLSLEDREKELEKIINQITAVHLEQTPHTPEFFAKLPEREAKFLEQRELREKMFGTMKPLGRDEYRKIYQSTGIDIDGRREMITHMIPSIEKAIKRFIRFAKALPGFKDLPVDDQIALIKASRFDAMMIQWSHMHNFDLGVSTCPHTDGFNLVNDFVIMFEDEEYVETIGKLLYGCQCLDMTHEEQAMMAAICVMCSPVTLTHVGCLIRDAALDTLGDAMIWLLRRTSDDSGVTFGKMINIITEFKALLERSLNQCETRWVYNYADIFAQFDNVGCFYEMLGINNPMTESTDG